MNDPVDTNERILELLDTMSNTTEHSVLSTEKIVAAVITLIVVSACLWVGTTLNATTSNMIGLTFKLQHVSDTMNSIKADVSTWQAAQGDVLSATARELDIVTERMRQDDVREENETRRLDDHEMRIDVLERSPAVP